MTETKGSKPEPLPERLTLSGNWENLVGRALAKKRTEGGCLKALVKKRAKRP